METSANRIEAGRVKPALVATDLARATESTAAMFRSAFELAGVIVQRRMYAYHFLVLVPPMALLFGSLVVVTGPTVITPLLRRVRVGERLQHILHWEAVLVDPVGVFVAVLIFGIGGGISLYEGIQHLRRAMTLDPECAAPALEALAGEREVD